MDFLSRLDHSLMEGRLVLDGRVRQYLNLIREAEGSKGSLQPNSKKLLSLVLKDEPDEQTAVAWRRLLNRSKAKEAILLQISKQMFEGSDGFESSDVALLFDVYNRLVDISSKDIDSSRINCINYMIGAINSADAHLEDGELREALNFLNNVQRSNKLPDNIKQKAAIPAQKLNNILGKPVEKPGAQEQQDDVPFNKDPLPANEPQTEPESPDADVKAVADSIEDDGPPSEASADAEQIARNLEAQSREAQNAEPSSVETEEPQPQEPEEKPAEEPEQDITPPPSKPSASHGERNVTILAQVDNQALVRIRGKSAILPKGATEPQNLITYRYAIVSPEQIEGPLTPARIWDYFSYQSKHAKRMGGKAWRDFNAQFIGKPDTSGHVGVSVAQAYRMLEQPLIDNATNFTEFFLTRYVGNGPKDGLLKAYLRWDPMDSYQLSGIISALSDEVVEKMARTLLPHSQVSPEQVSRLLAQAKEEQNNPHWKRTREYATEAILSLLPLTEASLIRLLEALEEEPDVQLVSLAKTALVMNLLAKRIIQNPMMLAKVGVNPKALADVARQATTAGQRRQKWLQWNATQEPVETDPLLAKQEAVFVNRIMSVFEPLKDPDMRGAFVEYLKQKFSSDSDEQFWANRLLKAMDNNSVHEFLDGMRAHKNSELDALLDVISHFTHGQ